MLALLGGPSEFKRTWPTWPQYSNRLLSDLEEILKSERWSISGPWNGHATWDQKLAQAFSHFVGVNHCIPTDHGTSALIMAMRALGIQERDEVIIPALTWVACASSVLELGALPIFVDIDPNTQCMSAECVEQAITPRTRAIMLVHLNSALANIDEFVRLSAKHSIPIVEDCSQCHGACWGNQKAGSFGDIGVFSLHQGKLLASGEGGLAVTSNSALAGTMELLRGNGRRYGTAAEITPGQQHLVEIPGIVGKNMGMSEFHACITLDGLKALPSLNERRMINAQYLDTALSKLSGVTTINPHTTNTARAYYHYAVRLNWGEIAGVDITRICQALTKELGTWVHPTYVPLNRNTLFQPNKDPYYLSRFGADALNALLEADVPNSEKEYSRCVLMHHSVLLGAERDMDAIIGAFTKVAKEVEDLHTLS